MPKDLTDASVWTPAIEVPVDTDPADAPSVEVGFQDLADRSRWLFERLARAVSCNLVPTDTSLVSASAKQLSAFVYDEKNDWESFFWHNQAGSQVHESVIRGGAIWPAISLVYSGAGTITALDSAASNQGRRHVVVSGIPDIVRQDLSGAGWGACTITGAPGLNWISVGCDRDATGGGYKFLIGDDGAGPVAPSVYVSTDGTTYAAVVTFPALTAGYQISGIFHTQHPVDALGPDDPGNPSWLVLVSTSGGAPAVILRSTDGVTWSQVATAWGGSAFHRRGAAYSRTGGTANGRWIVAMQGSAAGDIRYSDDNGATWTSITDAFDNQTSGTVDLVCDGFGTFIALEKEQWYHVSIDEGLTWETIGAPFDPTIAGTWNVVLGAALNSPTRRSGAVFFGIHESGTAQPLFYRTLWS